MEKQQLTAIIYNNTFSFRKGFFLDTLLFIIFLENILTFSWEFFFFSRENATKERKEKGKERKEKERERKGREYIPLPQK